MQWTDDTGPFEYLVLEFPGERVTEEVAEALAELVASQAVRVLDLVFLHKDADGVLVWFEADESDSPDADVLAVLDAEHCDLVSEDDIRLAGASLAAASCGCLIVVENLWEARLEQAVRRANGRVTADERVSRDDAQAALAYAESGADA